MFVINKKCITFAVRNSKTINEWKFRRTPCGCLSKSLSYYAHEKRNIKFEQTSTKTKETDCATLSTNYLLRKEQDVEQRILLLRFLFLLCRTSRAGCRMPTSNSLTTKYEIPLPNKERDFC